MPRNVTKISKGFTLIELLVVIAIIGLLSAVVLAALNTARLKARDAAVISGAQQLSSLMALEFSDNGSYSNLQSGWMSTAAACNAGFAGNYASNARAICVSIINAGGSANQLYTGNAYDFINKFSIMAYLPSKGTWYCIGSSGQTSSIDVGSWGSPGCYANP